MGMVTLTNEAESSIPPARLFKAFYLDFHDLFPKILPQVFKSVEFVEGDHVAAGCIKKITFAEGQKYTYAKDRIDELDVDNFYIKDTTIEGDVLGDKLECVVNEAKYKASSSGGTQCKVTVYFYPKGGAVLDEEDLKKGFEMQMTVMYKAVEQYLDANPEACT